MAFIEIRIPRNPLTEDFGKENTLEAKVEKQQLTTKDTSTLFLCTYSDRVKIEDVTDKELYNLQLKINEYLAEKKRAQREAREAV